MGNANLVDVARRSETDNSTKRILIGLCETFISAISDSDVSARAVLSTPNTEILSFSYK